MDTTLSIRCHNPDGYQTCCPRVDHTILLNALVRHVFRFHEKLISNHRHTTRDRAVVPRAHCPPARCPDPLALAIELVRVRAS